MAGPIYQPPSPEIYLPTAATPEADPNVPRCAGCERPMVNHEACEGVIRPAWACVNRACPEYGCKPCQMLSRWFKAQDAFLDLTMRLEDD